MRYFAVRKGSCCACAHYRRHTPFLKTCRKMHDDNTLRTINIHRLHEFSGGYPNAVPFPADIEA